MSEKESRRGWFMGLSPGEYVMLLIVAGGWLVTAGIVYGQVNDNTDDIDENKTEVIYQFEVFKKDITRQIDEVKEDSNRENTEIKTEIREIRNFLYEKLK